MSQKNPPPQDPPFFEKWKECWICAVRWPESMLTYQQGHKVCPDCVDDYAGAHKPKPVTGG